MLGITKNDFIIRANSFDITKPWNLLRITTGAFFIPHALSKFAGGTINPAVLGFFDKAGFQPSETWVMIAFLAELICGIALVLGICTRFAALGSAFTLALAVYALHVVKGFGWFWNLGGYEYPIFWAIVSIGISMNEFQQRDRV
jgi:putative oxidoreductase